LKSYFNEDLIRRSGENIDFAISVLVHVWNENLKNFLLPAVKNLFSPLFG
jgi:hypothetical protein